THPDQFKFNATAGKQLTFTLTATTSGSAANVVIEPVSGLPAGASIGTSVDGKLATATFNWLPSQPGDYSIGFVAKTGAASAPVRTYLIHVNPKYPYAYTLTDDTIGHWAAVLEPAVARKAPNPSAPAVTKLELRTEDANTQNIVLVLGALERSPSDVW